MNVLYHVLFSERLNEAPTFETNLMSKFLSRLPLATMRREISILCACVGLAIASLTVFSVHDDILAFPQVNAKLFDT